MHRATRLDLPLGSRWRHRVLRAGFSSSRRDGPRRNGVERARLLRAIRELQRQGPVTAESLAAAFETKDVARVTLALDDLVAAGELERTVTMVRQDRSATWREASRSYQVVRGHDRVPSIEPVPTTSTEPHDSSPRPPPNRPTTSLSSSSSSSGRVCTRRWLTKVRPGQPATGELRQRRWGMKPSRVDEHVATIDGDAGWRPLVRPAAR